MQHPPDDVIEAYAMKRLNEAEGAAFEEHLLLCGECQSRLREMDLHVAAMREALKDMPEAG